jgi:hypothetical protein
VVRDERCVIVSGVQVHGSATLFGVREARSLTDFFAGLRENRERDGSENRKNCDDDEEFDERETAHIPVLTQSAFLSDGTDTDVVDRGKEISLGFLNKSIIPAAKKNVTLSRKCSFFSVVFTIVESRRKIIGKKVSRRGIYFVSARQFCK